MPPRKTRGRRPIVGKPINIRLPDDLIAAVDEEGKFYHLERPDMTPTQANVVRALLWEAIRARREARKNRPETAK